VARGSAPSCTVGQNVFLAATAVVGDRVRIQNNVSIYDGVTLDDDVFVGPSAVLTNVICLSRSALHSKCSRCRCTRIWFPRNSTT